MKITILCKLLLCGFIISTKVFSAQTFGRCFLGRPLNKEERDVAEQGAVIFGGCCALTGGCASLAACFCPQGIVAATAGPAVVCAGYCLMSWAPQAAISCCKCCCRRNVIGAAGRPVIVLPPAILQVAPQQSMPPEPSVTSSSVELTPDEFVRAPSALQ